VPAQFIPLKIRDIRRRLWANRCFLCESVVLTQRQQHDVGHSVVATGRGILRLSSAISVGVWTPTEKEQKPRSSHHLKRSESSVSAAMLSTQKTFAE